jgi:hypothetical protein
MFAVRHPLRYSPPHTPLCHVCLTMPSQSGSSTPPTPPSSTPLGAIHMAEARHKAASRVRRTGPTGSGLTWRLLAGLLFWLGQQYGVFGLPEPIIPLFNMPLSGLGFAMLLVLSGFYLTGSATRRPWLQYLYCRTLKVLPPLAMATLVTMVLGGLQSALGMWEFLKAPQTWLFLRNMLALGAWPVVQPLPGVFGALPITTANAHMAPLPYWWVLAGVLPLMAAEPLWRLVLPLCLLMGLWALGSSEPGQGVVQLWPGGVWDGYYALVFTSLFALGVWLRKLKPRWHLMVLIVGAVLTGYGALIQFAPCVQFGLWVMGSLGLVKLAVHVHLDQLTAQWGNPSWGLVLYGFAIQQTVAMAALPFKGSGPQVFWGASALALCLTLLLAYLSWHLLEQPLTLRYKPHRSPVG